MRRFLWLYEEVSWIIFDRTLRGIIGSWLYSGHNNIFRFVIVYYHIALFASQEQQFYKSQKFAYNYKQNNILLFVSFYYVNCTYTYELTQYLNFVTENLKKFKCIDINDTYIIVYFFYLTFYQIPSLYHCFLNLNS